MPELKLVNLACMCRMRRENACEVHVPYMLWAMRLHT